MRLSELFLLYGVIGIACAIAVFRRETERGWLSASLSAAATVLLWPLWAPFVLSTPRPKRGASVEQAPGSSAPIIPRPAALLRIDKALAEAVFSVAGTSMEPMFSRDVAERIAREVSKVETRMRELHALSASHAADREASAARLRDLEKAGAAERTIATTRHKHDTLVRLEGLRKRDAQALEELADLLEALHAQLLLARYEGASDEGTGGLVSEVWARLEGLGAAFADDSTHGMAS